MVCEQGGAAALWRTVLFDKVPVGTVASLVQGATTLLSTACDQQCSGFETPETSTTLNFDLSRILGSADGTPVPVTAVRTACDYLRIEVNMLKPVAESIGDMAKLSRLALFYSPLSRDRQADLNLGYWLRDSVEEYLLEVSIDHLAASSS
jgi:hypothetical protein